jgi:hypothetical protein
MGSLTSHNPIGLFACYGDSFLFNCTENSSVWGAELVGSCTEGLKEETLWVITRLLLLKLEHLFRTTSPRSVHMKRLRKLQRKTSVRTAGLWAEARTRNLPNAYCTSMSDKEFVSARQNLSSANLVKELPWHFVFKMGGGGCKVFFHTRPTYNYFT